MHILLSSLFLRVGAVVDVAHRAPDEIEAGRLRAEHVGSGRRTLLGARGARLK